jgi:hypothetical protein
VLKKAAGSNADGILFFHSDQVLEHDVGVVSSMTSLFPTDDAEGSRKAAKRPLWVLQQYVVPATVTGGHKFHIRMPVLAVGALRVFCHLNCRVLAATRVFRADRWTDPLTHITNRSANYDHAEYNAQRQNFPIWALEPASARYLWDRMCAVVAAVFLSLSTNRRHLFVMPNCYELFGFDFMVSCDGTAHFYLRAAGR